MIHLIDNQYLGSINYYKILFKSSNIEIERYERHFRSGFSNRCYIAGANGVITLSIPLVNGRNQRTIVSEIEIDNSQKWQLKHWRALESSYRRSPWYEYYRDDFKKFYETEYRSLFQWNLDLFHYIMAVLAWKGKIGLTAEYISEYPSDKFADVRHLITLRNYLQFKNEPYYQVFEEKHGFLSNLSIIDLLFCCGERSKWYFKAK